MLKILHGDQTLKSRQALYEILSEATQKKTEIKRVTAKELTEALLEELLGSQSLFESNQLIVIEELHSLPRSKKQTRLIELVSQSTIPVVLWEKRELTKTMLKRFPKAEVKLYKSSNKLFPWLDSLGKTSKKRQLQVLQELKKEEGSGFVFAMLARQIRLLIATKDDGQVKGPPFVLSKLRKQAANFELTQLLMAHHKLLEIDYQQKISKSPWSIDEELDLWLLSL